LEAVSKPPASEVRGVLVPNEELFRTNSGPIGVIASKFGAKRHVDRAGRGFETASV